MLILLYEKYGNHFIVILLHLVGEICVAISLETAGDTRSWSDDLATELTVKRDYSLPSQISDTPEALLDYQESETLMEDNIDRHVDGGDIPAEDKCSEGTDRNIAVAEDKSNTIPKVALNGIGTSKTEKSEKPSFVDHVCEIFTKKNCDAAPSSLLNTEATEEVQEELTAHEDPISQNNTVPPDTPFDELLNFFELRHEGVEMPVNLQGILINQSYLASPSELNNLLFSPDSDCRQTVIELQGCTDFKTEPWKLDNGGGSLTRVITYTTAPSKIG
jgi:hypothetical protein